MADQGFDCNQCHAVGVCINGVCWMDHKPTVSTDLPLDDGTRCPNCDGTHWSGHDC